MENNADKKQWVNHRDLARTRAYHKGDDPRTPRPARPVIHTDKNAPSRTPVRTNTQHKPTDQKPTSYSKAPRRLMPSDRPVRKKENAPVPPLKDGDIRIIPICGVEGIGTNMTAIEFKDEIIVIDAGFGFSNPDTPGINYTIPDTTYLEQNKHKIKALVITHGHMDHVGGIPYVIEKIGNPPIYTREFGAMFIKSRLEEFKHLPPVDIKIVEHNDGVISLSEHLKVKFFGLTHSIPDSTGVIIYTPYGGIVSTGDVRVENVDGVPVDQEIEQYKFFKDEKILLMTMDSTGVPIPGWSSSEEKVRQTLDTIIKNTTGRLFIAAFSSQVERLISFLESAKKYGKVVCINGRSMKSNLGIVKHLNLTDFSHVIQANEINQYPANKVIIITTGGQGEQYSGLDRIGRGMHRDFKIEPTDTVILSSSIVPGNDWPVKKLKDNLYRGSYKIITFNDNTVHSSGHGKKDELCWIHRQIPYKYFMPIHGDPYMLRIHQRVAIEELGVPKENVIVPENGSVIEIRDEGNSIHMLPMKVVSDIVVVDGTYVGPLHDVVMKDRLHLRDHGMFVVVVSLDAKTGRVKKSPDIISRGFIYLRESRDFLNQTRNLVQRTAESLARGQKGKLDFEIIKKELTIVLSKHILRVTDKEPIVIPVVLGV